MKNFLELFLLSIPKFSLLTEAFGNPLLAMVVIPSTIAIAPAINMWDAFYTLSFFFLGDFLSGLGASYCEWRKTKLEDKWFLGKGEGFSSDKFKKMFVKIIVYLGAPLTVNNFQEVFMVKNLKYDAFFNGEIPIATGLILIFCLNEGFSIFHENLPKCGFNIFDIFKKWITTYKDIKKDIE